MNFHFEQSRFDGIGISEERSKQLCIKRLTSRITFFFGYKTEFFFLPKQSQRSRSILKIKDLDPSYKMDSGLWDCLGKVKMVL